MARLGTYLRSYRESSHESLRRIVGLYCVLPLLPLSIQRSILTAHATREHHRGKAGPVPTWMPAHLSEHLRQRNLEMATQADRQRRFASPARETEYRYLYPPEVARHPAPWSVELCRPFADRRLHEFLLAIPPEQKFRPHPEADSYYAGSKQLVRRGLRDILPESIRTRTEKTSFRSVFASEIRRNWPRYEEAFGPGSNSEIANRGYVDRDRFWSTLQALRDGTPGRRSVYIMELIGLETWLRSFRLPRERLVTIEPASWTEDQFTRPGTDMLSMSEGL